MDRIVAQQPQLPTIARSFESIQPRKRYETLLAGPAAVPWCTPDVRSARWSHNSGPDANEQPKVAVATAASLENTPEGSEVVFYSAQGCEPCDKVKAFWPNVAKLLEADHPGLKAYEVDCDAPENMPDCDANPLPGAYPSVLLHFSDGRTLEFRDRFEEAKIMNFVRAEFKLEGAPVQSKK